MASNHCRYGFANYVSYNYNKISEKYESIKILLKNFPKHNLKSYSLKKYISILKKTKNKDGKLGCILLSDNEKLF